MVFGVSAADSDNGRFKLCDERLFNHSPSFSTRLLISTEDFGLGFDSSSNGALSDGLEGREEGGLGVPKLRTEEILLLTEWPLIVENELSVSDEIVESGRGMISTLSEKPTRGRDGGLVDCSSNAGPNGSLCTSGADVARSRGGDCPGNSIGVVGRLELRRGWGSLGRMMLLRSWLEIAAERRCE